MQGLARVAEYDDLGVLRPAKETCQVHSPFI